MSAAKKDSAPAEPQGKQRPSKNKAAGKTGKSARLLIAAKPATGLFVVYSHVVPASDGPAKGSKDIIQEALAGRRLTYTLGIVDVGGYIQDVKPGGNPWLHLKSTPHSDKFVVGESCAICLVAHPDPDLARAMQTYLNTGKATPGIPLPPEKDLKAVLQVLEVEAGEGKNKGPVLKLPEESSAYWPPGSERYGKWNLYWGMPYAHVKSAQDALTEMMLDLGALRFPISVKQTAPYQPDPAKIPWKLLAAAIYAFQLETSKNNRAFKVGSGAPVDLRALAVKQSDRGRQGIKHSWEFLLGHSVKLAQAKPPDTAAPPASAATKADKEAPPTVALAHWLDPAEVSPCVVDKKTGDAISEWLELGLRKDNPILVEVWSTMAEKSVGEPPLFLWARSELALAIEAWRELAVALGCLYGVSCHHTFRELTKAAAADSGAVETSRHKLGLSVDLSNEDYRSGRENWPIRFEVDWQPIQKLSDHKSRVERLLKSIKKKADATAAATADPLEHAEALATSQAAEADLANVDKEIQESRSNCRPLWRLYGHSILDPGQPAAAFAALVKARMGFVEVGKDQKEAGRESQLVKAYGERLAGYMGVATSEPDFAACAKAAKQTLQQAVDDIAKMATKLESGSSQLVKTLFRTTIEPFVMEGFDAQGGHNGPAIAADSDARGAKALSGCSDPYQTAKGPGKPQAKSWLNLTRLGYQCKMLRIPGSSKPHAFYRRPDADFVKGGPMGWDPLDMVSDRLKDSVIRDLRALSAAAARDVELKDRALFIVGKDDEGKQQTRAITIGDIDLDFLDQWEKELAGLKETTEAPLPVHLETSDLVVAIENFAALDAALSFLKQHQSRLFRSLASAAMFPDLIKKGEVVSGKVIRERIEKLGKPPSAKASAQVPTPSTAKTTKDYSLTLRPVFEKAPNGASNCPSVPAQPIFLELDTGTKLYIPTRGGPGKFEWWHYDHQDHIGHTWTGLCNAIGYAETVLKAAKVGAKPFWQGGFGYVGEESQFPRIEGEPPKNGNSPSAASASTEETVAPEVPSDGD